MKLHLVKRVGMLAACAAAATVCAFGVASLNGLRYVRPTAENWTLLAYVEPAARVEQQVERSDGEYFATTLTGFDAQERRVWSLTSMHPFIVGYGDRAVYNGSEMTRYITSYGGYTTQHVQYDELGRMVRLEDWNGVTGYSYHGEESEPYLKQMYDELGVAFAELSYEYEYDSSTGNTTVKRTTQTSDGGNSTVFYVMDRYGNVLYFDKKLPDTANMVNMGYDENENASTRIKTDGSTVKIWYDDEQRELRREKRNEDGSLSYDGKIYAYTGNDLRSVTAVTTKDTANVSGYIDGTEYETSDICGVKTVIIQEEKGYECYMINNGISISVFTYGISEDELKEILVSLT